MKITLKIILGLLLFAGISACAGVGHNRIEGERSNYNIAIQRSNDEQLLLNLVRLRYRDTPFFLEVSSVATQFTYNATTDASARLQDGVKGLFNLGASARVEERPTVTYAPLQGEDFIQRFLAQIPMETVVLLFRTGWRLERVLQVCLQTAGPLKNAPTASGPTPSRPPEFQDFIQAMNWLDQIQEEQGLDVTLGQDGDLKGMIIKFNDNGRSMPQVRKLNQLFGLDPDSTEMFFTTQPVPKGKPYLRVEARSLIGIMYYLSHGVEATPGDLKAGRVTVTRYPDGSEFHWKQVTGDLMRVHSSEGEPENSMAAIQYRNQWYYIADSDLNSKSTFSLLGQLFSLQSGNAKSFAPTLTLPVGGS